MGKYISRWKICRVQILEMLEFLVLGIVGMFVILMGDFPHFPYFIKQLLFLLDCMGDFWPSFQGPNSSKSGLRGGVRIIIMLRYPFIVY